MPSFRYALMKAFLPCITTNKRLSEGKNPRPGREELALSTSATGQNKDHSKGITSIENQGV